ncbi:MULTISPECIES: hypothetical protein [Streptosporangium]|uniref:Secreted protein n=1 Tax=Streptosporangium brasiliense TaxID=47480 RepID=A0ABT9RA92_9ACTN|nr:hypothetical protein [Streptosporangium brasiliense]MDP9865325.1 hypothetical protein [Streptosporangium brasiliense]
MKGRRSSALGAAIIATVALWPAGISAVASTSGPAGAVAAASSRSDISTARPCRRKGPLVCCGSEKGVRCHRSLRERRDGLEDLHDEWRERHRRDDQ